MTVKALSALTCYIRPPSGRRCYEGVASTGAIEAVPCFIAEDYVEVHEESDL